MIMPYGFCEFDLKTFMTGKHVSLAIPMLVIHSKEMMKTKAQ
jgi:hypothetical protein